MLKTLLTIGGLQLATMLVMLLRTKVLAVFLGPEGVGLMGVVDKLLAVVVQALSLSLPFAALRFLPQLWNTDRAECHRAFRSMASTLGVLACVAAVGGAILSMMRPSLWGPQLAAHPTLLAAAFLSIPAVTFIPYLQNAFAGILRHHSSMLFGFGHAVVQTAAGLLGAALGSLTGLYLIYAGAALALVAPAFARLDRTIRPETAAPPAGWRDALPSARILRFSAAMFALTVIAPFAALYAHYAVLNAHGAAAAGWMQAAIGISLAVRSVLGAAHPVYLTPQLNKGGSWHERMAWAARFQHLWCLITGVLVPPLLIGADLAILILYAESFLPATQFVYLFVFAEVLMLQVGTYQGLIVAADRLRFHVAENMLAQLIFMGVAWWAIPRFGIVGAAFGAMAAQAFVFVCTLAYLRWKLGLRPPWRTTALMLYVLGMLAAVGHFGAAGLILGGADPLAMLGVYALAMAGLALFLGRDERAWLKVVLRRIRGAQPS